MFSPKQVIIRIIQELFPANLVVVDWGPKGAVLIDRELLEKLRENRETGDAPRENEEFQP